MKKSLKREDFAMVYNPKQKEFQKRNEKEKQKKSEHKEEKERE